MILKQLVVGMMGVCCYILGCEETREAVIIDPGGDTARILAAVKADNLTVKYLIATHGHPDHVDAMAELKAAIPSAQIVMHREEASFFARKEIVNFFNMLGLGFSPAPDLPVGDRDTLQVGNISLQVIHTPGHTPGGICLYAAPNLFSGDTLFAGGVGRTDFPGGSTEELLASIKNRLLALPPETVVWPGHGYGGESSTIGHEAKSNPFLTGGW